MSAYKFKDPNGVYFITFTVVEWVDVFTREAYVNIVLRVYDIASKRRD
jgi:putative transposase